MDSDFGLIKSELLAGNPVILEGKSTVLGPNYFMLGVGEGADRNIVAHNPWSGEEITIDSENWTTVQSDYEVVDMRSMRM